MRTYEIRANGTNTRVYTTLEKVFQSERISAVQTLWAVDRESEDEADKRRLDAAEKWHLGRDMTGSEMQGKQPYPRRYNSESVRAWMDRVSPPPAPIETQLDWQTGEPIPELFACKIGNVWFASQFRNFRVESQAYQILKITSGLVGIGPDEISACRNLAEFQTEIQAAIKGAKFQTEIQAAIKGAIKGAK